MHYQIVILNYLNQQEVYMNTFKLIALSIISLVSFNSANLQANTPKLRPVGYKIEYRDTSKSQAGYWMVFYDEYGKVIAECRCDNQFSTPLYIPELDLSDVKKMD
jgi:hypothetical protein